MLRNNFAVSCVNILYGYNMEISISYQFSPAVSVDTVQRQRT